MGSKIIKIGCLPELGDTPNMYKEFMSAYNEIEGLNLYGIEYENPLGIMKDIKELDAVMTGITLPDPTPFEKVERNDYENGPAVKLIDWVKNYSPYKPLFVTTSTSEEDIDKLKKIMERRKYGVNFFRKPLTHKELSERAIKSIIEQYRRDIRWN